PEQLTNEPIDRRADIFALGIVLWEISTGRRLFRGQNDFATVENVRRCVVPRPSSLRSDYPGKLERVVMKALRKKRGDRYATARELGEDLCEVLGARTKMLSSIDVERFMSSLFGDRMKAKMDMERSAARGNSVQLRLSRSESSSFDAIPNLDDEVVEPT